MFFVGNLDNARMAQAYIDYMMGLDIYCTLQQEPDTVSIWVDTSSKQQVAEIEFKQFITNPNDPKYLAASWHNANPQIDVDHKNANLSLLVDFISHTGPVTLSVFVICVFVYLTFMLGIPTLYEGLSFFPHFELERMGQIWRLFTPALLHFSIMHIVFNLLWWWYLGGKIEQQLSARKLLLLFILASSLPNIFQYYLTGPAFGGLSGVVYALVGYFWWSARLNPKAGLSLPPAYIVFMLLWLVLGLVDAFSVPVANGAHLGGLLIGCIQAWFDRDKQRNH
ncbi:rhomboid family intramembrane serine protease GlpG [Psychrobium sp. 1_MG-2023]|uniref:rhomboid family intramembrane serine protease GlpG n=1 Tax=Psychrobium sp. 1_MG-2023 TaxID=3062624 RepID=UPI000C34C887|nr:rhomboid family intramembrane serine protease GlpG [Psychrobium sp. 1_MG-2023]MDP2559564.1 rhomboid family intramembrane serine protease GlpG [Psychrobium sp. 1_MG-2023]PKF59403.1 rhomboid family intramembrane serine protease GlpG [Alteromonadales bacterium alter-6D02]